MDLDLYAQKLAYFKEHERPEAVLLVADDPHAMKIAVAWTNTTVTRARELSALTADSDSGIWEWLWRNTTYSREELLTKSAAPQHEFGRKLAPLVGNRILYPDGTVNSFVERYLRDRVLKLFEATPKRSAKRP